MRIVCTTDHAEAKCCGAFSIAATIHAYTIHDADTPDFHAEVTVAILDEISLTPNPANPAALVMQRCPAKLPDHDVIARIEILKQRIQTEFCHGH